MTRVNFVSDQIGNIKSNGVQNLIQHITKNLKNSTPEDIVNQCLDTLGGLKVEEKTFEELVQHVTSINPMISANNEKTSKNIASILSLIAGTREYQFC